MQHPELPLISFLCFVMVLSVLPSHLRAGSVAIIALIGWLSVMNLIRGINSILWSNNIDIKVPVWCDITTKLTVGFNFAVPAAALCILKHLESIASTRTVSINSSEKKRRQIFEGVMCFGLPAVYMALHYIVQGHRYDLYEFFGCQPTIYYSIPALFLYYGPPLVMSCISFVFASLSLHHFLRLRINFGLHLRNNNSAVSASRYFRLMAMAVIVNMWDAGINTYVIVFTNQLDGGLRPWISWANVHFDWSFIAVYPTELFPSSIFAQVYFDWWIVPISCFIFFIFFGFGSEAQADYRAAAAWVWVKLLRQKTRSSPMLPLAQTNVHHVAIGTPRTFQGGQKPWDPTSTVTTQEVKSEMRPSSHASSVVAFASPSSSDVHEFAPSVPHPYAILPETDIRKSRQSSPETELPMNAVTFMRPPQESASYPNVMTSTTAEPQTTGDDGDNSALRPASRQSWSSNQSHDSEDHRSCSNDTEHNDTLDFVVVPKTLSLEFVPRFS